MPGRLNVEQHQVDVLLFHDLKRSFAGGHTQHPVILPQHRCQRLAHPLVVVDDEERLAAFGHGRRRVY